MSSLPRKRHKSSGGHRGTLASSVASLPGIGPKRQDLLRTLGIETVGDLLVCAPRRYLDRATFATIAGLRPGQVQSVIAKVASVEAKPVRGKRLIVVTAEDGSRRMRCVWFNQAYLRYVFEVGSLFVFSGQVKRDRFGISMVHPEYEKADSELLHTGRIVPVYPTRPGLGQKQMRALVKRCLDQYVDEVADCLPQTIRCDLGLMSLKCALRGIHFPSSSGEAEASRRRLAFDEVLVFQTLFATSRAERKGAHSRQPGSEVIDRFSRRLAFDLTASQSRALGDILGDVGDPVPMRRLLQGDVGCGKTVVAATAASMVCEDGGQVALMCPTEILAEQHFETMCAYLEPLGFRVGLLTGSMDGSDRMKVLEGMKQGSMQVVVGTHALIGEQSRFKRLRLVIVDEEQRFGVLQRQRLLAKAPDANLLVVSATPIPRTLALTAYGDLDVTTIDEMPPGRGEHASRSIDHEHRNQALKEIAGHINDGLQGFYVCPAVEEGEGGLVDVNTAKRGLQKLMKHPDRLAILTGRTDRRRRVSIVEDFRKGIIDLIVATTVIEVGMDIPSARVLIVDQADRFGLSQLHQMRGRVARTKARSFSYFLVSEDASERGRDRVRVLETTLDGFEIAEKDLMMRGPGDVIGTRQHGLSDLRFACLPGDTDLMLAAREEAFARVLGGDASPEWQRWLEAVGGLTKGTSAVI
jgi:ATP-dependent DNA helicase RecG